MSAQTSCNSKLTFSHYQFAEMQQWFAGVISRPLVDNLKIQPYTPEGSLIAQEAAKYIVSSPTLQPDQRIQIYNQQYWWRLLNTLQANFPLVTRLFGRNAFNEQIAIPYLLKHPSNHWSLNVLGSRLTKWIEESYHASNKTLVFYAAALDWAFLECFIAIQYPYPNLGKLIEEKPEHVLAQTIYLQPHVSLFKWEYDLFTFRDDCLKKGVDDWIETPFPELPSGKACCFVLYRNVNNYLAWRSISLSQYVLLQKFKNGSSLGDACAYVESQDEELYEEVAEHLHQWIQDWMQGGWLTLDFFEGSTD